MEYHRIFVLVMDSVGIGSDEKAALYADNGANTLMHIADKAGPLNLVTLNSLGLYSICKYKGGSKVSHPHSLVTRLHETSNGKDTLTGHHEMMGIYTLKPFKTFTDTGFPISLINELEKKTGHKIIGNKAASGTEIIKELGEEQIRDNSLIVYTSSDSVLQIAASEEITGLEELYRCCYIAREICMKDEYKVGRVIARPFVGDNRSNFKRTSNRHDYALKPESNTVLDYLKDNNLEVISIGKINDIFAGCGITKAIKTTSNSDGMNKTMEVIDTNFKGLCFINLVEFDSEYGHRRDVVGYKNALETFDKELATLISKLHDDDLLMITADHGNDPTWKGTDHTREKTPLLIYSKNISTGRHIDDRDSFSDIGATILNNFNIDKPYYLIGSIIKEVF